MTTLQLIVRGHAFKHNFHSDWIDCRGGASHTVLYLVGGT